MDLELSIISTWSGSWSRPLLKTQSSFWSKSAYSSRTCPSPPMRWPQAILRESNRSRIPLKISIWAVSRIRTKCTNSVHPGRTRMTWCFRRDTKTSSLPACVGHGVSMLTFHRALAMKCHWILTMQARTATAREATSPVLCAWLCSTNASALRISSTTPRWSIASSRVAVRVWRTPPTVKNLRKSNCNQSKTKRREMIISRWHCWMRRTTRVLSHWRTTMWRAWTSWSQRKTR